MRLRYSDRSLYIEEQGNEGRPLGVGLRVCGLFDQCDRNMKIDVDGKSQTSIIRPTSGAVETENSLRFNELCRFRQQVLQFIEAKRKLKKRC